MHDMIFRAKLVWRRVVWVKTSRRITIFKYGQDKDMYG